MLVDDSRVAGGNIAGLHVNMYLNRASFGYSAQVYLVKLEQLK